jgi:hypothetical protein
LATLRLTAAVESRSRAAVSVKLPHPAASAKMTSWRRS